MTTSLQEAEDSIFSVGREIELKISALEDEIRSEDGRGRHPDWAAFAFAHKLFDIWVEFTGRSTARHNTPEEEKHPFGNFVEAVGKLIEPDFGGHHLARQIHEARRSPSGAK